MSAGAAAAAAGSWRRLAEPVEPRPARDSCRGLGGSMLRPARSRGRLDGPAWNRSRPPTPRDSGHRAGASAEPAAPPGSWSCRSGAVRGRRAVPVHQPSVTLCPLMVAELDVATSSASYVADDHDHGRCAMPGQRLRRRSEAVQRVSSNAHSVQLREGAAPPSCDLNPARRFPLSNDRQFVRIHTGRLLCAGIERLTCAGCSETLPPQRWRPRLHSPWAKSCCARSSPCRCRARCPRCATTRIPSDGSRSV